MEDKVALISGVSMPMILRKSERGENYFEGVGPAFIPGLMDGEMDGEVGTGSLSLKDIVLV